MFPPDLGRTVGAALTGSSRRGPRLQAVRRGCVRILVSEGRQEGARGRKFGWIRC